MKKDKLITIRVSEETRDKFNQWCKVNEIKGSTFLSDIINGCIDGIILPKLTSQSIDKTASHKIAVLEKTVNYLSSQLNTLEEKLYDKLSKSIYSTVNQKVVKLEKKISSLSGIDDKPQQKIAGLEDRVSQLESLYKKIDKSIVEPKIVETETAELEEVEEKTVIIPEKKKKVVKGDSRRAKSKDKADTVKSADKPTHDGKIDINAETEDLIRSQVLSGRELMIRFGKKIDSSSHSQNRKKGKEHFLKWSHELDPKGYSWWLVDENDPKKGYKRIS